MAVTPALPFTYALTHIKRTFQRMLNWSQLIKDLIMNIFGHRCSGMFNVDLSFGESDCHKFCPFQRPISSRFYISIINDWILCIKMFDGISKSIDIRHKCLVD